MIKLKINYYRQHVILVAGIVNERKERSDIHYVNI